MVVETITDGGILYGLIAVGAGLATGLAGIGAGVGEQGIGLAGKGIANAVDPVAEDAYWRDHYSERPYASGSDYDEFRPAYGYGVDAYTRYPGRTFDDVEAELRRDWNSRRGSSSLEWDRANHATRDAWQRLSDSVERATPGDSDLSNNQVDVWNNGFAWLSVALWGDSCGSTTGWTGDMGANSWHITTTEPALDNASQHSSEDSCWYHGNDLTRRYPNNQDVSAVSPNRGEQAAQCPLLAFIGEQSRHPKQGNEHPCDELPCG